MSPTLWSRLRASRLPRVLSKFAAASAVATGCTQLAFLLLYGVAGTSTVVAGVGGWLAGAVPNFLLQRYWTWRRSGRVAMRGELLPYVAVIAFNGLVATGITTAVDRLVGPMITDHAVRTVVLGGSFFASYVLLFGLKFVLLDRVVFGRAEARARRVERSRTQVPTITRA